MSSSSNGVPCLSREDLESIIGMRFLELQFISNNIFSTGKKRCNNQNFVNNLRQLVKHKPNTRYKTKTKEKRIGVSAFDLVHTCRLNIMYYM